MKIVTIKSKSDYKNALEMLEQMFDAKKGTKEGEELEKLANLIEKYEEKHYPIDLKIRFQLFEVSTQLK
jgi:HTH-type transcriptional regulator / antitoxin HigA